MKCEHPEVRHLLLLHLLGPNAAHEPPDELAEHIAACPRCQETRAASLEVASEEAPFPDEATIERLAAAAIAPLAQESARSQETRYTLEQPRLREESSVDVTISKKWKVVIAAAVVIAATPLYLASGPGMKMMVGKCWEKSTEQKTPETLMKLAQFYSVTYRDDEAQELCKEFIRHYGGDETEKDPSVRWDTWDAKDVNTYPWDEEHPRPDQKGEDYRKTPHPLTTKALLMWANNLENNHRLIEAVHIYKLIADEGYCAQWNVTKDPDVYKHAVEGIQRNMTGNRGM